MKEGGTSTVRRQKWNQMLVLMALIFESGAGGSDEQLKIPGDTVLIMHMKKLSQQLMLTSPIPIKFGTRFNLRRLRSRLAKGRVIGTGKRIRSWCVLRVPFLHPPLLQGPLLVLAQWCLRWLPAPPLQQVSRSLPSETGRGPGPQFSTTIFEALAVTSDNAPRTLQPRCCHPLTAPRYRPVWHENQKQFVFLIFPRLRLDQRPKEKPDMEESFQERKLNQEERLILYFPPDMQLPKNGWHSQLLLSSQT